MMRRRSDWQSQLGAYLERVAHWRFAYGELDCGLFAANAIEAMTGVDIAVDLRGRYSSRPQAFAAIQTITGAATMIGVAEHFACKHGLGERPVLMSQRGDLVALRTGRRSSLGIVAMHGTEILAPYGRGILRLPISHATRSWQV